MEPTATPRDPTIDSAGILLTDPSWRQRVVEKVVPLSADHYELRRSFQFEIPPTLLADTRDVADLLLPVCWLPKHTLLEFDVATGSGSPLCVLERRSIAGVLAAVLEAWRVVIPALSGVVLPEELLESVCVASLDPWRTVQQRSLDDGRPEDDAIADYLSQVFGPVQPRHASRLLRDGRDLADRMNQVLDRTVGSPISLDNTITVAAILAPYLVPRPSQGDLIGRLDDHHRTIESLLDAVGSDEEARSWMDLVARASVSWPLMVQSRVDIGRPFSIKTREVRDSGDPNPRVFRHEADLQAARSFHLQVRPPDEALWIPREPEASTVEGQTVGALDVFENSELTQELFATYTSLDPRPDRVVFCIRFGLKRPALLGYWYALALVILALWWAARADAMDAQLAALLTLPTTFVTALLVARGNTLTSRYFLWWRVGLMLLSIALWYIVGARTLGGFMAPFEG